MAEEPTDWLDRIAAPRGDGAVAAARATAGQEGRLLRLMLALGAAVALIVWIMEGLAGVLTPWDQWSLPVLAALLGVCAVVVDRRPRHARAARTVALTAFNAMLALSLHLTLFSAPGEPSPYQLTTAMYFVPLCYGCWFMFFAVRTALIASAAYFVVIFGPIFVALAVSPARWGAEFPTLLTVLALAQLLYVVLLFAVATMRAAYHRASERVRVMQMLATTDPLTGLANRRGMTAHVEAGIALAGRTGQPLSVLLIDVDHFKRINDEHGHATGDTVLHQLGRLLGATVRASDHAGRWGGEEFLVVAPGTTVHAATELGERIRAATAGWAFAHGGNVTVSVGVTQHLAGDDAHALLQRADAALYRAKQRGRDRVEAQPLAAAS
jgi:diguanylate cyclase (GGDEF)-like protein